MNRIILFRYHTKPSVCIQRLNQLKKFNPGIKIFGLYGGKETRFPKYKKHLGSLLEHNYCIKNKTGHWKWKNGDLAIRLWYKDVGKTLNFDMLHFLEWDLLFFDSLDNLYKKIPKNSVGLTALNPLKNVKHQWSWTSKEPYKSQWIKLLKYAKDKFTYTKQPYASLGPGYCLPKNFLEKYTAIHIPELGNDELRLPLFAQVFKFKLVDTEFFKKWSDPKTEKFFNCNKKQISLRLIKKELTKENGRRSFHPYRKKLNKSVFIKCYINL